MSQLNRFVEAQKPIYPRALAELQDGAKRSHWMWFIFPQIAGLGRSETARFYAIQDADEAETYLAHPVLGPRLLECCAALMPWAGRRTIENILGPVDAMKLRSSMTLFAQVAENPAPFEMILSIFFGGHPDEATLALLRREQA
ncbi:DUF1810 domain-containing protein [Croceicoccus sp. BE223]|uniref:DUF1810 domain-containing protein n=1 Tax=Croceicoccus sp. BE223 TaxID=2817716 RepID=UPI00285D5800|nr:DUF1810 domain-containing protein [Croceicoccus sp. BE223]MDR7101402.1 uncharacterized protein (DUF1810 family) [Croceicoccus sp. BE223]